MAPAGAAGRVREETAGSESRLAAASTKSTLWTWARVSSSSSSLLRLLLLQLLNALDDRCSGGRTQDDSAKAGDAAVFTESVAGADTMGDRGASSSSSLLSDDSRRIARATTRGGIGSGAIVVAAGGGSGLIIAPATTVTGARRRSGEKARFSGAAADTDTGGGRCSSDPCGVEANTGGCGGGAGPATGASAGTVVGVGSGRG
jgi:hypothetical protein